MSDSVSDWYESKAKEAKAHWQRFVEPAYQAWLKDPSPENELRLYRAKEETWTLWAMRETSCL